MTLAPGAVILAHYLLWPGRLDDEKPDNFLVWLRPRRSIGASALREEDVNGWLSATLPPKTQGLRLWALLLGAGGVQPDWSRPAIPMAVFPAWLALQNQAEPDTLLLSVLAEWLADAPDSVRESALERIGVWPILMPPTDFDLDLLTSRPLSDVHMHMGAARGFSLAWLDITWGAAGLEVFDQIAATIDDQGERDAIERGLEAHAALRTRFAMEDVQRPPGEPSTVAHDRRCITEERRMIVRAWLAARAGDEEAGETLDQALVAKSLLWRNARQPLGGAAGLDVLSKRHLRAPLPRGGRGLGPRFGAHRGGVTIGDIPRQLATVAEASNLKSVELRLKPYANAADYRRMLDRFAEARERQGLRADLSVRFGVHFMRPRSADPKGREDALSLELARDSAALHQARSQDLEVARAFNRIDVAGAEGGVHGEPFVHHTRLMRGEADAIADLDYMTQVTPQTADEEQRLAGLLSAWSAVRSSYPVGDIMAPPLRATWHAGEDFADVLEGLYEIGVALDDFHLRPGDSIGHGLALTARPDGLDRADGYHPRLAAKTHLFSLIWLRRIVRTWPGIEASLRETVAIDEAIAQMSARLSPPKARRDMEAVDEFFALRIRPRFVARDLARCCCEWFVGDGSDAGGGWNASIDRMELILRLQNLLPQVQKAMVDRLIDRRVFVEMNPSSNLRIYGARSLSQLPTIGVAQLAERGLLLAVGTDDPGPFGARIEHEYALVAGGLLARDWDRTRTFALLERIRALSVELTPPLGAETWTLPS